MQTKPGFFIVGIVMQKRNIILITSIVATAMSLIAYEPILEEYAFAVPSNNPDTPLFKYVNTDLWQYLRLGLNYLESPESLSPPESMSPTYVHPDLRGFGAYGLSPEAFYDVQRLYPFFQRYNWQDIMNSQKLYDLANQAFADWLLQNLQDYLPEQATQEEIFDVLHRAWNLGLSGFKNGKQVVLSRINRAEEFKVNWNNNLSVLSVIPSRDAL
jgi:hypothetical protein